MTASFAYGVTARRGFRGGGDRVVGFVVWLTTVMTVAVAVAVSVSVSVSVAAAAAAASAFQLA